MNTSLIFKLYKHVISMHDDNYLVKSSEWNFIVGDCLSLENEIEEYKNRLWAMIAKTEKTIAGWKVGQDNSTGCIIFSKDDNDIYATPFWEDNENIEIVDYRDENNILTHTIEYRLTFDIDKDVKNYFDRMQLIFDTILVLKVSE